MWLPTPVYERVPQFWILLGLLFMSSGTYLGFDYALSFLYFAVGLACVLWSGIIFVKRARYRSSPTRKPIPTIKDEDAQKEEDAQKQEQTAEPNESPAGQTS